MAWTAEQLPLTQMALDAWDVTAGTPLRVAMPDTSATAALKVAIVEKGLFVADDAELVISAETLHASPLFRQLYRETGVGQAAVMAFVDITNLQLAGRPVTVVGFGNEGRGIAAHVAALGGKVTVQTDDRVARILARNAGYFVGDLTGAEVVFATASFDPSALAEGALVCGVTNIAALFGTDQTDVRDHVAGVSVNDRTVFLIAGGKPAHLAAGDGVPLEIADVTHALAILSATTGWTPEIDAQVARWKDDLAK